MTHNQIFYVYEHWRPDTDVCFYVGKGHGKRSHNFKQRGRHHNHVLKKLARLGMCAEVRIVSFGLVEEDAFILERERIAFWRSSGVKLANLTDGGDGPVGLKWTKKSRALARVISKDRMASLEMRKRISDALKGRRLSGEALENFLFAMASRAGVKTGPMSESTKAKIAAKALGRKASPETIRKMVIARTGLKRSTETRAKQSAAAKVSQKIRFEKLKATKLGREEIRRRAIKNSHKAASDPLVRALRSANAKALWADPSYRSRMMASRSKSRCVSIPIIPGFS